MRRPRIRHRILLVFEGVKAVSRHEFSAVRTITGIPVLLCIPRFSCFSSSAFPYSVLSQAVGPPEADNE